MKYGVGRGSAENKGNEWGEAAVWEGGRVEERE